MKISLVRGFKSAVFCGSIAILLLGVQARADDVQKTGTYEGTLQVVSLTDRTISVERAGLTKTFQVEPHATIITLKKKEDATLNDLRSGFTVRVTYSESDRIAVTSSIVVIKLPATQDAPPASAAGLSNPLPPVSSNAARNMLTSTTNKPAADEARTESDVGITQRIRKNLMADESLAPAVRNITIVSVDGNVTLRGPVKSELEKMAISDKTKAVSGVKAVENQLEVK